MGTAVDQLLAGALAGSVTALTMSPLDVARTRMQIQCTVALPPHMHAHTVRDVFRLILSHEGARGFFSGYSSAAIAMPLYWAAYFPVYQYAKSTMVAHTDVRATSSLVPAVAAVVAALVSDTITAPFWVVRTRMQTQAIHLATNAVVSRVKYRGLLHAFRTIREQEGTTALYKGLVASWLGTTHVAVQFPAYEWLRNELPKLHHVFREDAPTNASRARRDALIAIATSELFDPLSSLVQAGDLLEAAESQRLSSLHSNTVTKAQRFAVREAHAMSLSNSSVADVQPTGDADSAAGATNFGPSTAGLLLASTSSKLLASLFTYPQETIRARLQDQRDYAGVRYRGIIDCGVKTVKAEGFRGLYSGFSINMLRSLPATAVTFFGYEAFLRAVRGVRDSWDMR